ncbi:MAG: acyl carrier protein [Gammaproteobacteria bacterium]
MDRAQEIKNKMADLLSQPVEALADDVELTSLVTSSFVLVEMIIELQEEFDVRFTQPDVVGVTTVGHLVKVFTDQL